MSGKPVIIVTGGCVGAGYTIPKILRIDVQN